jgi:hypothetical protein
MHGTPKDAGVETSYPRPMVLDKKQEERVHVGRHPQVLTLDVQRRLSTHIREAYFKICKSINLLDTAVELTIRERQD